MMAINKILILHGWESNPKEHWYLAAKEKFEKDGFEVFVPEMPGAYFPKLSEWLDIIENYKIDSSWALIGHSLGGVTILKYLEDAPRPAGQAIIIAAPFDSMRMGAIDNFFPKKLNFDKIHENCPKIDLIYQKDDVVVPLENGYKYEECLDCPIQIIDGYSHVRNLDLDLLSSLIVK